MAVDYRVAVIGGGIVGCSVLFHLTRFGWKDVVLLERKELTAGSTWHAAGGIHAFNGDPNIAALQAYTIRLYSDIQHITGQDVGLHLTGGISLAATNARLEFLRNEWSRHRIMNIESELLSPTEVTRLCPIVDVSEIKGALYMPAEGHVDPYSVTHAFAKAARMQGAKILRHTRVIELMRRRDTAWELVTEQGTITAEHVINAAGLWAREVGDMVGLKLPLLPMEHHYLITGALPALRDLKQEIPTVVDLDGEMYLRQEHDGVLLGVYETPATPWAEHGTPWEYGQDELLPDDLDRLMPALEKGFRRFPEVADAGIKRIVNGPFTFTPDGNPLVGPVAGIPNYWCACGVMAGFAQGGGIGLTLAHWLTEGEPDRDVFAMDVARFGSFATRSYVKAKAREFYERRFALAYPNEYWPAARPLKTTPLYETLRAKRAVWGVSFGLEIPLFYAPPDHSPEEQPSFRRSNAFPCVAQECRTVRAYAGILEISGFAKYRIEGPGAERWLDKLLPSKLPDVGRIRLAPMLSPRGRLIGDFTALRTSADVFLLIGSGTLQEWHMRWFRANLPARGVTITNVSDTLLGLAVAGPNSRTIVNRLAGERLDNDSFPFLSVVEMDLSFAPAVVARVSVTGETAFEIYVPAASLNTLYNALMHVNNGGMALGNFGIYALNSLRLEKGYGIWSREFSPDYTPGMCSLDRFINYDKPGFIGREAVVAERYVNSSRKLVHLQVESNDADPWGFESVWCGSSLVGFTTSGGFGHTVGNSLAMAYVDSSIPVDSALEIEILGNRCCARILTAPPYDPDGLKLRT